MLATLARVVALRRTRLLFRPGGGRGLWTGRPQSGTLRDAVRAAKGTPAPVSPSGGAIGRAPALSRSVSCPRSPPFGLSRLSGPSLGGPAAGLAPRPGRPGVTLLGVRAGGREVAPARSYWADASPLSLTPTLSRLPSLTHFAKVHPAAFQKGFQSKLCRIGGRGCAN